MSDSPALKFVRHLYTHGMSGTGHSWTRLNSCLYRAVQTAIEGGLAFEEQDVRRMKAEMKGDYWFHDGGPEHWYAAAIKWGHRSAWKALEAYLGREPFIDGRSRLHVGSEIKWQGQRAKVTSFNDEGGYLVAVVNTYKGHTAKVAKRFRITRDELRAASKKAKPAPAEPAPT